MTGSFDVVVDVAIDGAVDVIATIVVDVNAASRQPVSSPVARYYGPFARIYARMLW